MRGGGDRAGARAWWTPQFPQVRCRPARKANSAARTKSAERYGCEVAMTGRRSRIAARPPLRTAGLGRQSDVEPSRG